MLRERRREAARGPSPAASPGLAGRRRRWHRRNGRVALPCPSRVTARARRSACRPPAAAASAPRAASRRPRALQRVVSARVFPLMPETLRNDLQRVCDAFAPEPKRSFPRSLHMPRAIWSGAISFGLVNVPVRMYSAIEEKDLHFHLIHEPDNGRIGYQKFCKKEEKLVPDDEIVKAFETSKDKHVVLTDEDFEAVKAEGVQDDRHLRLRPLRRDRSDLLRPHLLPRAAGRCREGVRADARGDGADRPRRDRQVRDARARSTSAACACATA